ncbi:hypothetical protein CC85DRAFT_287052 [Cutaneotrichosporon oleaginosum]|uniref:Uncharacterized protein n=1 Tax=Cutaneotrichosporon oleaginosum TaxID=879819 RepID=A0A0J1AZL4_9TREE|nr:uncharacterized protein CC85DRAFT_287052 [Cutaneotrichosporon oleaginosum]KLT40779.1 hypothetical protein CC85DRAFT_287052 [Cutaneotrichosporon oleaginosum]TXT11909.1 hypothetical protein COLE_02319 [Cutaneotrichosporon oleaginosum]
MSSLSLLTILLQSSLGARSHSLLALHLLLTLLPPPLLLLRLILLRVLLLDIVLTHNGEEGRLRGRSDRLALSLVSLSSDSLPPKLLLTPRDRQGRRREAQAGPSTAALSPPHRALMHSR